jgi:hypothetical protein
LTVASGDGVHDVSVDASDVEAASVVLHGRHHRPRVCFNVVNFDQVQTFAAIVSACKERK